MCLRDTEVGRLQVQQYPGILPLSFVTLGVLVLSCILHLNSFRVKGCPETTAGSQRRDKLLIPGSKYEILVNDSDCPGLGHIATSWPITSPRRQTSLGHVFPLRELDRQGFVRTAPRETLEVGKGHWLQGRVWYYYQISPGLSQEVRARTWFSDGGSCACSMLP